MKQINQPQGRKAGRPLSFDRGVALDKAMRLFWAYGYESTSVSDLTTAMGITPPSLYSAFGDKKQLFLESVARYLAGPVTSESLIDQAGTARDAAWALLEASAIGFTGAETPKGCLLASSAISCSIDAADVQNELTTLRRCIEQRLKDKIEAQNTENRAYKTDAEALAGHIMAVIQGMSTLARDGASREKLFRVAKTAMQGWPD